MRVLLTGASGFIGHSTRHALQAAGHDVVALCRTPAETQDGEHVIWDLAQDAPAQASVGSYDAVVHLAQSRDYKRFPCDARCIFDVNVGGTQRLLDFAAKAGIKRFCLVSSGAVYEPFVGVLREDVAVAPSSYLGASKLAAEILATPYASLFELSILRLFTPYGPGQTDRLVPDLIHRVRSRVPVVVTSDGQGMRVAPTFVIDIAQVIRVAIEEGWVGITNVAAPIAVSTRDLADAIGRAVGIVPSFEQGPGNAPSVVPNLDKLAAVFPLSRFRSLEDGLTATVGDRG